MSDESCDLLCLDVPLAERIRSALPDVNAITRSALHAKACADPTRMRILLALCEHELCVCDLTWIVGRSQNLVSHHLRTLRTTGMVTTRRDAKVVFYEPTAAARRVVASLVTAGTGAGS